MSDNNKTVLLALSEMRTINYTDLKRDETGAPILDENKQPQVVIVRVEEVSALSGLDMAMSNATALVQEGHDFFDVQDLRQKIKSAFDKRRRAIYDDRYLVLSEAQHKMILAAIKKFDWSLKRKVNNPDGTVTETEPVAFWVDWFDFFNGLRNPVTHNLESPNPQYALWLTEKKERLSKEEAEEAEAIRKAADKAREEQAPEVASDVTENTDIEGDK